LPFRLVWSSCEFCASTSSRSLADRIGLTRRLFGKTPATSVQTGISISPVGDETFAFLAATPIEPASLDVVDEWLVAQDEEARQGPPAKREVKESNNELQLVFGNEWPAEERKDKPASVATATRDVAGPHQTRTQDDALQLWFGDTEARAGDVDASEKKAPSTDELRGDTLLDKWPVSRLVH
jgi:hypothetical protein